MSNYLRIFTVVIILSTSMASFGATSYDSTTAATNAPQTKDFASFWAKFSRAVLNRDKAKVVDLTRLPMVDDGESDGTPFGHTKFIQNFNFFFHSRDRQCFRNGRFDRVSKTEVYLICSTGVSEKGYTFRRLPSGWKWVGFASA